MRWFETEIAVEDYSCGEWDRAEEAFAGWTHGLLPPGRIHGVGRAHVPGDTAGARDDQIGAVADADGALDFARGSLDRQMVLPTLADCVLVAAILGRTDRDAGWRVSPTSFLMR